MDDFRTTNSLRVITRAVSILMAASLFLAACQTAAPASPSAAEPTVAPQEPTAEPQTAVRPFEGKTLRLMTWAGYAPEKVIAAFETETGAKVEITLIADNGELVSKLRATNAQGWDLVQPSVDNIRTAQELYHIFQAIDTSKMPNYENVIPSLAARVAEYTKEGDGQVAVPFAWGTSALIVNTAKVSETTYSYAQLCDPKYAGRVTTRVRFGEFEAIALSMGQDPFKLAADGDLVGFKSAMDAAYEKLLACKPNIKAYWSAQQDIVNMFTNNEVYIGLGWDATGWLLSAQNPQIKYIAPKEGALGWVDTYAIPAGAENIDLAYAFMDFNFRPDIAGLVISDGGFLSASQGALDGLGAAQKALINETYPQAAIDSIKWYPPLAPEFDAYESQLAEQLKAAGS